MTSGCSGCTRVLATRVGRGRLKKQQHFCYRLVGAHRTSRRNVVPSCLHAFRLIAFVKGRGRACKLEGAGSNTSMLILYHIAANTGSSYCLGVSGSSRNEQALLWPPKPVNVETRTHTPHMRDLCFPKGGEGGGSVSKEFSQSNHCLRSFCFALFLYFVVRPKALVWGRKREWRYDGNQLRGVRGVYFVFF